MLPGLLEEHEQSRTNGLIEAVRFSIGGYKYSFTAKLCAAHSSDKEREREKNTSTSERATLVQEFMRCRGHLRSCHRLVPQLTARQVTGGEG